MKSKIRRSSESITQLTFRVEKGSKDTSSCDVKAHMGRFLCTRNVAETLWTCSFERTTCGNLLAKMKTQWTKVEDLNDALDLTYSPAVRDVSFGYGREFPDYCNFQLYGLDLKCLYIYPDIMDDAQIGNYSCKRCLNQCDEDVTEDYR